MSAPRWFDIYGALLAGVPALAAFADWSVNDGAVVSNEYPPKEFIVGFSTADETAGTFQQAPDPSGFGTAETGEIRCRMQASVGDTDISLTRNAVQAAYEALQRWLFGDPTLGALLSPQTLITLSVTPDQAQTAQGSGTAWLVTVAYQTAF